MQNTGLSKMEIIEDSAPIDADSVKEWHRTIEQQLTKIASTLIGSKVLEYLNPYINVYIIPLPHSVKKQVAMTSTPQSPKEGGGIRIRINPKHWGEELDEVLVHELTHAARGSNNMRYVKKTMRRTMFPDIEEFFAMIIENIYRSCQGKTNLQPGYGLSSWVEKKDLYEDYVNMDQSISALRFLLESEPLAAWLARESFPDFNPFRDYADLRQRAQSKLKDGELISDLDA